METGCDITTVYRWISRSSDGRDLYDRQRSGRPHVYAEDIQLKTIAFYCQISPLPGCDSWTLRWAEGYLKEHRELVGDSMSYSTIQRILKNHSLRPHLHKYFLSITDPDFFPKMEHIIDINLNPPDNLFYYDECTVLPSDATIHYVMDNLNTHFNDYFCQSVAELSNVTYTPLKTGKERRQWLQSEDKRIVVHFTPFHGSWLNMIEIWFRDLILSKSDYVNKIISGEIKEKKRIKALQALDKIKVLLT